MDELIWVGVAVALAVGLKWWRKRRGAPAEPPAPEPPAAPPDGPPVTLPVEPPAAGPDGKGPLRDFFDRLRRRRRAAGLVSAAAHDKTERGYQVDIVALLNSEGVEATDEFVLADGSRVDVVTDEFAIEIDFAKKWAECVGQALHYSHLTNKKPVCLLLVGVEGGEPGVDRCRDICHRERIEFWTYDVRTGVLTRS